jgi:hypothetical protein
MADQPDRPVNRFVLSALCRSKETRNRWTAARSELVQAWGGLMGVRTAGPGTQPPAFESRQINLDATNIPLRRPPAILLRL